MPEQIQESQQRIFEISPLGKIESNLTTTCHAVLKKSEDEFVVVEENDADFVVADAVSTDTNWCRPTPVPKSEKSHCDEAESTYLDNDLQDPSTRSLSVDRHHLGVDQHSSGTEAKSTFNEAESSELDTEESTPDSSVDRHSPSVDRHWTRTEPYALVFPPPPKKSEQERRDEECRLKLVWLLEKKPNMRLSMAISELVSAMIQCSNPEKLPDPGSFLQDCSISTRQIPHSLCDLGSSINMMPHSVAVETSKDITAGFQDEVQSSDTLLQIAEPHCRNSAEIRAAGLVSSDTTMVSVDTRLDETDNCQLHHTCRTTPPPVSVDTHDEQNQSCPTKLFFELESLLQVRELLSLHLSHSILLLNSEGKRSRPPIPKPRLADIPYFLGRSHAPTAYTPSWMMRSFSRKYLLPPSDPPDARILT
ncbi:hypothetical protein ISN45_Aa03g032670 [Arabidopsis thaliana x Arabidopsis arenosa]|uniref:Uncharacterized protein n=1 Tax=Arabidopsis thaliana x Arabidopsis arenosa TaxID=1240361 RepID=A0A8T2AXT9_9BRAS|nr:hypothetical protein ISN45_Aa03g032670 [Arabidopsis thaliana x Arabidopsis arenosa]